MKGSEAKTTVFLEALQRKGWMPDYHFHKMENPTICLPSAAFWCILQYKPGAPMALLASFENGNLQKEAQEKTIALAQKLNLPFVIIGIHGKVYFHQLNTAEGTRSNVNLSPNWIPTPDELWQLFTAWAFNGNRHDNSQGGESACPLGMGLTFNS